MSAGDLDPRWTDRAPTMRVLDPLGAESIEGSLQNRLLRPVLSIAITQRLRYLSYWAWVTANVDQHSTDDRPLYEKVLLVASVHHDCPSAGTGTNGIMGGADEVAAQLEDPAEGTIDISSSSFTIAGDDIARFDSYYKGVLYRLLLFENEQTLTPLGEQLADAYAATVDVDFDEVSAVVDQERLPTDLVARMSNGGCLCQLSDRERDLLTQAYLFMVTPTSSFDELAFDREAGPTQLELREFLETSHDAATEREAAIEASLAGLDDTDVDDTDYSEDLDRFFTTGRDAFIRGSLVLLLGVGDWLTIRPTPTIGFDTLADAREAWRLLVHAEYGSHAFQSLFVTVQEAVRELEPVAPAELLTVLFADEAFDRAAGRALAGVDLAEAPDDDRRVFDRVRDAVYFDEAPAGSLTATVDDDAEPLAGTWGDVRRQLQAADPSDDPFAFSGHSERAYRTLIQETLSEPPSIEKCRRVVAYSGVQLARLSTRYDQYYATDAMAPFASWFATAHDDPSTYTCWQLSDAHDTPAPTAQVPADDWATSAFAATMAGVTRRWILDHYFERLYRKIKDGNGRSPQFLQVDADGQLTFDHEIANGRPYNRGYPNSPTLKFDRLGDIFYELDLIEDNTLYEIDVTDRGRQLVAAFTGDGGQL